jgi:cell division protease FtsH
LARNHHKGTGAEIQDIVNEGVLMSFRSEDAQGTVTFDNMTKAMLWKRFGESEGTFENPDNVMAVAVHEAGHAVVMHHLLKDRVRIWFASIEQRGRTGGMVARSPLDDDWQELHDEMLADVAISLASRVAEGMILGQYSNGHGGDGPAATQRAEKMVMLGHGTQLSFSDDRDPEEFHKEREAILQDGLDLAHEILTEHKEALVALATALTQEPTLIGDKVHELLAAHGV